MLLEIIIEVITTVIGIFIFTLIWERINRPKLIVEPTEKSGEEPPPIQLLGGKYRAFYCFNVKNVGRTPAKNLEPKLVFHKDGNIVCGFFAKWDFKPQPFRYELTQEGELIPIPEPSLIPQGERIDIQPGAGESFCTVIKYEGEDECYGFSSYSYLYPDQKKQEWKLYPGKYSVRLNLTGDNARKEEWLKIECKRWDDVKRKGNIKEIFSHAVVTNVES